MWRRPAPTPPIWRPRLAFAPRRRSPKASAASFPGTGAIGIPEKPSRVVSGAARAALQSIDSKRVRASARDGRHAGHGVLGKSTFRGNLGHGLMVSPAKDSADSRVRIGVVGVGIMGSNHARVLADLPGVKLIGVADPGAGHRALLAQVLGCEACDDTEALLALGIDAAVIAAPTHLHHELAL